MTDSEFICPACGQTFSVAESLLAQRLLCPHWQAELTLNAEQVQKAIGVAIGEPQGEPPKIRTEPTLVPPVIETRASRRNDPATEKQMEKMRFFGCTWEEGITKGQASNAIDHCVRNFPEIEKAWQNSPATMEQIRKLEEYGEEVEPGVTHQEAKQLIQESEMEQPTEDQKLMEHLESEDGCIDDSLDRINFEWADEYREVKREEVARAWTHAKQKSGKNPGTIEVLESLEELFADFRRQPHKPGFVNNYCLHCRGEIEVELPKVHRKITSQDIITVPVRCPHCGRETVVMSLRS